jgi:hypothetical protein
MMEMTSIKKDLSSSELPLLYPQVPQFFPLSSQPLSNKTDQLRPVYRLPFLSTLSHLEFENRRHLIQYGKGSGRAH